jgi:plasmid stabilization system protein ParE
VRIQLAPEAVDDLTAVIEYLHERNPRAAVAVSAAVFDAI